MTSPALAVYAVVPLPIPADTDPAAPVCDLCGNVQAPGVDCCDPAPRPRRLPRPYPQDVVPLVTAGLVALLAAVAVAASLVGAFDPAPSAGSTWNPHPATAGAVWLEPAPPCGGDADCAAWARTHT